MFSWSICPTAYILYVILSGHRETEIELDILHKKHVVCLGYR